MTPAGPLALRPPPSSSQQEPCLLDCEPSHFLSSPRLVSHRVPRACGWPPTGSVDTHGKAIYFQSVASSAPAQPSPLPRSASPEPGLRNQDSDGHSWQESWVTPTAGREGGGSWGSARGARMGVQAGGGRDQTHLAPSSTQSDTLLPIAKHKVPRCLGAVAASPLPGPPAQPPHGLWEAG